MYMCKYIVDKITLIVYFKIILFLSRTNVFLLPIFLTI